MYDARYATRNPYYGLPEAIVNIGAGEESGRFTDVRSMVIYRGNAFPPDYLGNAFVADGAANLVHRDKLRMNDVGLIAEPAPDELGMEFLTCKDQSFQPMQLANAPDGTLFVAGLVRETAARFGTARTNVNSNGIPERGRIYRVAPINFKRPRQAQMGKAGANELVAMLRHPDGWHRDTAARLLYERRDKAAIAPLVQLLYDVNSPPLARMHALHALDGMSILVPAHLARALNDPDDRVREHAVLLSEKFVTKDGNLPDIIFGQLGRLTGDPSPPVRYQLAFSLGQFVNAGRVQIMADLVRSDASSRWMRSALLSSLSEGGGEMFRLLAGDANLHDGDAEGEFLRRLLLIIGAINQTEEVVQTLNSFSGIGDPQLAFDLAQALDNGLQSVNNSLMAADSQGVLKPLYSRAAHFALDPSAAEPLRAQAIRLLAVIKFADPQMGVVLTQQWPYLNASLRSDAVVMMLSWPAQTEALLSGLERRLVPMSDLSSTQIKFLVTHPDASIRQRAIYVFGNQAGASRREVVDRFEPALQLTGTASRGRELFMARCAVCHQVRGEGNPGGLDLAGTAKQGGEKLLVKILDPNREAAPNFSNNLVQTSEGLTLTGFITGQTAKSITLWQANGVGRVVGRQIIQSQESLNISAMPEGLEAGLKQQDMADLLEYINPGSGAR